MADILTNQQITELCARSRNLLTNVVPVYEEDSGLWCYHDGAPDTTGFFYNPLQNRAQAMELVEKLKLDIQSYGDTWEVAQRYVYAQDNDLLCAICLCAGRVQLEKEKQRG